MSKIRQWLRGFVPPPVSPSAPSWRERLRACCGALLGILLTGLLSRALLGADTHLPWLIAPIGASSVLLFALPASPLAQPWSIIGGNLVSALIGVFFAQHLADPLLAAPLAIACAIAAMFALRCLHPPSGAVALIAVLGGPAVHALGYGFALLPVGLNSLLLLLVALLYNNLTRHRYPHPAHDYAAAHATADIRPVERLGFTAADLDAVLKEYNQVLDVSRDDLEDLFLQTEMHAYRRRFGEIRCADIMSRDIVAVEFGTSLEEAWTLLNRHDVAAMPVIDRARRVIGIVGQADFVRHANIEAYAYLASRMRALIRRTLLSHSDKPEVVGQIMCANVKTMRDDMHIVELVPLMSDAQPHHLPIVDGERRLVGMVTQSDLVAALYRGRLNEAGAASNTNAANTANAA